MMKAVRATAASLAMLAGPLAAALTAVTQEPPATRRIELGDARTIRSEILGENRELQISLPETYGRTFLLDGSSHLLHATATVRFLAAARNRIPEMIVVALFESACAWSFQRFNLSDTGRTDPIDGAYVSGGLFQAPGVNVVAGRPLTPADDVRGGGPHGHVAVVSHRFWQRRFGGARDVLERQLTLNRVRFRIVGIAPQAFEGPEVGQPMDVFVPLASEAAIRGRDSALDDRSSSWLQIIARLRPDQNADTAAARRGQPCQRLVGYFAATAALTASARRDWKGRLRTTSRTSVWNP